MEYFDVLDKNRNFINKTLPRGAEMNEGEFNQGSEVFIILPYNRLLITQRSELKSHPLMWEAPGGCTIAGENTLETSIREMNEEIGLSLKSKDFKLISTQLYKYQFVDIYIVKIDNLDVNNLKLQPEEISNAKIVSFDEFEKMIDKEQIVRCTKEHYYAIKDKIKI